MTVAPASRSQALLALHLLGASWLSWRAVALHLEHQFSHASEDVGSLPAQADRAGGVEVIQGIQAGSVQRTAIPLSGTPRETAKEPQPPASAFRGGKADSKLLIRPMQTPLIVAAPIVQPLWIATMTAQAPPAYPSPLPVPPTTARSPSIIRLDSWAVIRPGSASNVLVPSLGGSQLGLRLRAPLVRWGPSGRLAATASASTPVSSPGKEASIGVTLQPAKGLPVELIVEHRFRLDKAGQTRMVLLAAGGVSGKPVADGWAVDAYAQGGMAGLSKREMVADGSVTMTKPAFKDKFGGVRLGGGLWGAAQPGLYRLDAGPLLVLQSENLPVRVSLEWRQRLAGNAAPGSGPALTVSGGF